MTDIPDTDATSVWNKRYEKGEHVGSRPVVEGDPTDYTPHKFLYERAVALPQTGSLDGWNLERVGRLFLTPAPRRMLAIGSGMAFVEEQILQRNFARHILAYEMSASAVERARARLAEAGLADRIEMRSADVLEENLPDGAFDVVFVQAAIHHFDRIEEMFALMHRVLRPGGLLIFDEYVGPDHHLYHPEVLAIMDEINACLAPRYRWDVLANQTRKVMPRPSLSWMLQHDPSEGVHASGILPLTYQWFEVLDRADYGGTIMRPFFTGILPNFDFGDPKDQTVASLIVLIEQLLTRHGVIPHYHTSVVARRRETLLPPLTEAEVERIAYSDWPGLRRPAPAPAGARGDAGGRAASPPGLPRRLLGRLKRLLPAGRRAPGGEDVAG
jgi:ubiquinone/menaquinone biosynthesis C-methylase UbiE